ncbi:hypothetical protein SVIOM74S_09006 [Streptomyces violarus]
MAAAAARITFWPWLRAERSNRHSAPQRAVQLGQPPGVAVGQGQVPESARGLDSQRLSRVTQRSTTSAEERIR